MYGWIKLFLSFYPKISNITNELNNIDWAIIDHLNIDDVYALMVSKIQNALNTDAPEKTIKIPYKKILPTTLDDPSITKIISNKTYNVQKMSW